jgi:hypothetical protein
MALPKPQAIWTEQGATAGAEKAAAFAEYLRGGIDGGASRW